MIKDKNKIKTSINQDVSESDVWKTTSKELKENLDKIPKLAKEYYKIPSLSEEQKKTMKLGETIDWWTKEKVVSFIWVEKSVEIWEWDKKEIVNRIETVKLPMIMIKKIIEWNEKTAYVIEYIEGMPEKFNGVQLFNEASARNLNIYKYLPTRSDLLKMLEKRMWWYGDVAYEHNQRVINKFIQDNALSNTGLYTPERSTPIMRVNADKYYLLLKDKKHMVLSGSVDIETDGWIQYENSAFPIRLIEK